MHQIVRLLPKKRQTMLFSATTSIKVDELAKTALHSNPIKIGVAADQKLANDDDDRIATVEGLEQVSLIIKFEKKQSRLKY